MEAATPSAARKGGHDKSQAGEREAMHGRVLHLPDVRIPDVHLPVPGGMAGRVLWWGGLAGVAALGWVDWPVAALVGAGSWVAERYARAAQAERPAGTRKEAS